MANLDTIKKGDKIILRMFTGAFVGAKTVAMADDTKIGIISSGGVKMIFSKATGKQLKPQPKNEKFANYVEAYDADVEATELAKKANVGRKRKEKN